MSELILLNPQDQITWTGKLHELIKFKKKKNIRSECESSKIQHNFHLNTEIEVEQYESELKKNISKIMIETW